MNLSCIIVDDEPLAIRLLEKFVERTPFLSLKASFTNSVAALQTIRDDSADLLFLDIQMPDMDGMELSHMVPPHTRIIFTTAFKEYAFDSYEVNALDFLLKPIRYNKFLAAAEKAKKWFEMASQPVSNQRTTVFLKVDGELQQVPRWPRANQARNPVHTRGHPTRFRWPACSLRDPLECAAA